MDEKISQKKDFSSLKYWHGLASFLKFGPLTLKKLVRSFGDPEKIFQAMSDELKNCGSSEVLIDEFIDWRTKINLDQLWQNLEKENIKIITLADPDYPILLKEIYDPPIVLYCRGELKKEEKYPLAVVGTRRISNYGKQITPPLVRDLAKAGLTIISGLALGIDGLAHQAALDVDGRTIAVLGSGIDDQSIYPAIHRKLARQIIEKGGVIVSELPPGTLPLRHHFPLRNRIISGLSLGTLVIEAPETSGALITARSALEQNREVFAVPGSLFNPNSTGPNRLIKMGAKAITKANDILEALNLELILSEEKEIIPANKEEEILLKYLCREPIQIDELIEKSGLAAPIVSSTLMMMEISGKVKNLGGGYYVLQ